MCVELTAHYQEWLKEVEKLRVEMTQGKMWAVVGLHVEEEHHHMIVTCQRWLLLPMYTMLMYVHVHACIYTCTYTCTHTCICTLYMYMHVCLHKMYNSHCTYMYTVYT